MPDASIVLDHEFLQDPHRLYTKLREEAPAHRVVSPDGLSAWLVTDYEHAAALLNDPRLRKDAQGAAPLFVRHLRDPERAIGQDINTNLLTSDPPDHTRLRRLVNKAFTPRTVERLRPRIEQIADELLDAIPDGTTVDLIEALAYPLPTTMICELLGVPAEDRTRFGAWTSAMLASEADAQQVRDAGVNMGGYLAQLVADKRVHPGDDVITALVRARDDEDRLNEVELTSMAFNLLVAGLETTVNLIGNSAFALLANPAALAALRADPAQLPAAVEEFLRYEPPLYVSTLRYTAEPVAVGEVTIPEGEFVLVSLSAACRDPRRFPDPDSLDFGRGTTGHLAFGYGIHYCIGAPLARMETEVLFRKLIERFSVWSPAVPLTELRWRHSWIIRGLERLPVRFGR
ncbi:cytochrome P450 [Lentzea sp. NBRC 105346]|nr:cytochrome P450 [Lentzea sp. NBRC 105346]GLZ28446.1 cytochrome P450 [Lentzea sp. NBRC 105346]